MCLGKVFMANDQQLSPIMDNVTSITTENGQLILTSLLGEKKSVEGKLIEIDFNKSKVIIEHAK
ncbi:CooT family nickel-binding protein [Alkalibaculum sp. M08DMB]|uniref:CooT family nickel-binding protein n=1 Tax=Alkalibaculum sporogenes TaxID=2655001 RepID=A0A6A7KCI7_9FIRM|nr:CooT family nickel-binding protein [Alkalibaculum sporogenes]MPW27154.1 CooT family nickel-binding protein [Alkalibaculum sporogenes]